MGAPRHVHLAVPPLTLGVGIPSFPVAHGPAWMPRTRLHPYTGRCGSRTLFSNSIFFLPPVRNNIFFIVTQSTPPHKTHIKVSRNPACPHYVLPSDILWATLFHSKSTLVARHTLFLTAHGRVSTARVKGPAWPACGAVRLGAPVSDRRRLCRAANAPSFF